MIYNCDKIAGKAPANYHNYICDTASDLSLISLKECCPGSTATILNPVYTEMILGANYKWYRKPGVADSGGSTGGANIEEIPEDKMNELLDAHLPLDGGQPGGTIEEIPADRMDALLDEHFALNSGATNTIQEIPEDRMTALLNQHFKLDKS